MAYFVREMTGIDPLTVDQTLLGERSDIAFEHPWRTRAEQLLLINDKPVVLMVKNDIPLAVGTEVDALALSPRTVFHDGRPCLDGYARKAAAGFCPIPECAETTCVVEARDRARPDEVAYDRVEAVEQDFVVLYLPNGISIEVLVFKAGGALLAKRVVLK